MTSDILWYSTCNKNVLIGEKAVSEHNTSLAVKFSYFKIFLKEKNQ